VRMRILQKIAGAKLDTIEDTIMHNSIGNDTSVFAGLRYFLAIV
jgi:hypothetical protein